MVAMLTPKGWYKATRKMRCPICEKPDWCVFTDKLAVCYRQHEGALRQTPNGGYLHSLDGERPKYIPFRLEKLPEPEIDFFSMFDRMRITDGFIDGLAAELGVCPRALEMIPTGWSGDYQAMAFPMKDGTGKTIGIRLRTRDGAKFAWPGSRQGLFIPEMDGELAERMRDGILICEGPTSLAALLTLGIPAIGRPSNLGGKDLIVEFFKIHYQLRRIGILKDRDTKPIAVEQTARGVKDLAEALSRFAIVKVFSPPRMKDARDWLKAGATFDSVLCVWRNANSWKA